MEHQVEIEKQKYRNWVKGGLAYKYLKQGIKDFADEVVLHEHNIILRHINHTPGRTCNQCSLSSLKPLHEKTDNGKCPRGQINCSCLHTKNKIPCPHGLCDAILEEILKCHPPTPNWKNTDIQKWCSSPWEVAKCFINSPGYSNKTTASDIDASGLLHIFINNINLHSHLSCLVTGSDILSKTLQRRNTIFHSPTMELEDKELNDCIDDIIAILEDDKELKQRPDAKQAVKKLKQAKQKSLIITTNNEVEVCRDAMKSINDIPEELKQMIQDAKADLDKKKTEVCEAIDDKMQNELEAALKQLEKQSGGQLQVLKQAVELLDERIKHVEADVKIDIGLIRQRLTEVETSLGRLDTTKKQLEYVEQKQALQNSLLKRYEKDYFKTWISPLKTQDNDVNINEVYVTPNTEVEKKRSSFSDPYASIVTESLFKDRHQHIFQSDDKRHKRIYIIGDAGTGKSSLSKMMIYSWFKAVSRDREDTTSTSDTCNERNYVDNENNRQQEVSNDDSEQSIQNFSSDSDENSDFWLSSNFQASRYDKKIMKMIKEMSNFEFLFTIPLQRMSGFSCDIKEMINSNYKDLMTDELMSKIFNQESERCLIIADGLDEWTPPKHAPSPEHVSSGIPVADGVKNATLVTLSRPSAKGILNMKSTEYDQKIKLLGVHEKSVQNFIWKYMKILNQSADMRADFMQKLKQGNLKHLERTPLLLQQLTWMYCRRIDIGKSIGDIYSNIINIMLGWSQKKGEDITQTLPKTCEEQVQLPEPLKRFPRCKENQKVIIILGKLSFEALTAVITSSTFGRSELRQCKLLNDEIDALIRSGILEEYNCFDPTSENTYLSFIHISYLEFFAAVYISSCAGWRTEAKKVEEKEVLEKLFEKYKSAEEILQLSNLLKMVCGLSPLLLKEISRLISKNMICDRSMISYRNNLSKSEFNHSKPNEPEQIQNLMYTCLSECREEDQPVISLCDVVITEEAFNVPFTRKIISDSVCSVYINWNFIHATTADDVERMKWIAKLARTDYLTIESTGTIENEACEQLTASITELVSLKRLTLKYICAHDCEGHTMDLSKHDKLQSIHLECSSMLGSVVNAGSLESVYVSHLYDRKTAHLICKHLSTSITQTVSLKQLSLKDIVCDQEDCEGHTIDLPNHDQLQSVVLERCSCMLGSVLNATNLREVSILGKPTDRTAHRMCENLSSSLTQAVSLKQLTLEDIVCNTDDCEGHIIDLPNHDQLQSVVLEHCSCMLGSVLGAKNLQEVTIFGRPTERTSHVMCKTLSSSLTQAVSLKQLTLEHIVCNADDCEGHTIDLLDHDQLQNFYIEQCSAMLGSVLNAKSLQDVFISGSSDLRTSHVLCGHLSSSLSQAVSLKTLTLKNIACENNDGHAVDLPKHSQLEEIHFEDCSFMVGCVLDANSLTNVDITGSSDHKIAHATCENFSSSLTQTVSLKRLKMKHIVCDLDKCEGHAFDLPKHHQLLGIHIEDCTLMLGSLVDTKSLQEVSISGNPKRRTAHVMCEHLSSSVTQAVALEQLTLKDIICDYDHCEGHSVDLSKHGQLQSICLDRCSCVFGSTLNAKCLNNVDLTGRTDQKTAHATCEHLSSSLTQVVLLKQLTLKDIVCAREDCEGHTFDLPKHDQLQTMCIDMCSCMLGSVLNAKSLHDITIKGCSDRKTAHVMCENISLSLSQAVALKQLALKDITCNRTNCEGHGIELSKQDHLQRISLHGTNFVSRVSSKMLDKLDVSSLYDVQLLLKSFYNSRLKDLCICNIQQYTTEINNVVQTLQQLETLKLEITNIEENALTVTSEMQNLEEIELSQVKMSLQTWSLFVDSLLKLQNTARVYTNKLSVGQEQEDVARQYVSQNTVTFKVLAESNTCDNRFDFASK